MQRFMIYDAKKPDEKVKKKDIKHSDILLTWCQTSGCLKTLTEFFTSHLGVWQCRDRANGKQIPWQSIHWDIWMWVVVS